MIRVLPYVPEKITVHLGAPEQAADNITLPFSDYIKNVASGEIYPTWEQSALSANILSQVSFALNKIYLEYYPSRGYNFDITSSTAYDQSYQPGRNIFENINYLVDELFDNYIRRPGFAEPLSAKFCNGTTTTCDGLSQWGSQELAEQGKNSVEILKQYYGDDIEIVVNAPVSSPGPSYPGTPIRLGDIGPEVKVIQTELNQISQIYSAIPKINPVDGFYGQLTEEAIKIFQRTFSLAVDGICGKQTWYKLVLDYVAIRRLGELDSLGQTYFTLDSSYPYIMTEGNEGENVRTLQYYLSLIAAFDPLVPETEITGIFDGSTKEAVIAVQRGGDIPPTGVVDAQTWNLIYERALSSERVLSAYSPAFAPVSEIPDKILKTGSGGREVALLQKELNELSSVYPSVIPVPVTGIYGGATKQAVRGFQRSLSLHSTGEADSETIKCINDEFSKKHCCETTAKMQYCGRVLKKGDKDFHDIPQYL